MIPRLFILLIFLGSTVAQTQSISAPAGDGPIRVLFLGHPAGSHPGHQSHLVYPMLSKALGRDAIYFDYVTTPEAAFSNAEYLNRFDVVLLYANHKTIKLSHWRNLKTFIDNGGGFVPVHCASWCFQNIPEFDKVVGGRFRSHRTGIFKTRIIAPKHAAMSGVEEFPAWDETYFHINHNVKNRTVLMVRDRFEGDPDSVTQENPEPWTWIRTEGKGRIFYTASGHDERVWSQSAFHDLLKAGIVWAAGDDVKLRWEKFRAQRKPLQYEKRDNIPNYEKRENPLPYQLPLSPEESMKYTQLPVDFRLELFASEPGIVNPISLAWDERGRLWVAETVDYPNEVRSGSGNDTIKILEDTNGDGKADKTIVFADGLNIPTSIVLYKGGVIVAQAPDFLFLKDTNGDGVADERKTILSGWGTKDTHAGPSNLRYGFDNWIWGTVGYSGFNGKVGGKALRFGSGVFRMKGDGSELEFMYQFNNNTWGLGFNAAGDVFGSTANKNPAFFCGIPQTIYKEGRKGMSAAMIADSAAFHPITPNVRQVDALGAYTAGAGFAFASSASFPLEYRNRIAFIGGPTGHLLGRYRIEQDGSGFVAKNAFAFLASADEWVSPVAAEVGPDGHLWISDWYNFIIQHNPTPKVARGGYDAKTGPGNAHINPNRDRQHGRIYRAIWEKAPTPALTTLENASMKQLTAALDSDNLFWRLTAQRLLVEAGHEGALTPLRERVKEKGIGAIHALWSLAGMDSLDQASLQFALSSKDADLRRNAIRALGTDDEALRIFFDSAVVSDPDLLVRLAAFNKLGGFPRSDAVDFALKQLAGKKQNSENEWLRTSLKAAGASASYSLGPNLLPNPSFEKMNEGKPSGWRVRHYAGEAEHSMAPKQARTGGNALRIFSKTGADTSWCTDVEVKANTEYRLSGWILTAGVNGALGAFLNVHQSPGGRVVTRAMQKKNGWTTVDVFFNSGKRERLSINCCFGGWGKSVGSAWYDDVTLREVLPGKDEMETVAGDADRGRKLFMEHPLAGCIRCHTLKGKGGPIGPPLDGIASRKEKDYILKSLVDPMAEIAEGFEGKVSPMPPMNVLLKPQELSDVMAFLMTLKE